ncbi:MAG: hypothetical protein AAF519_12995 [Bacteroidota bacterium]
MIFRAFEKEYSHDQNDPFSNICLEMTNLEELEDRDLERLIQKALIFSNRLPNFD